MRDGCVLTPQHQLNMAKNAPRRSPTAGKSCVILTKLAHFYFYNVCKHRKNFHIFFTVKFGNKLRRKLVLKLPSPSQMLDCLAKSVKLCNFIIISENNLLNVRWRLFDELLINLLFYADVIMTSLRYFVCCVSHTPQLWHNVC